MFPRVLLNDEKWILAVDWFGLGKLVAWRQDSDQPVVASPAVKSYFLRTCEALQRGGLPIEPTNLVCQMFFRAFAQAMWEPETLNALGNQSPEDFALWLLGGGRTNLF